MVNVEGKTIGHNVQYNAHSFFYILVLHVWLFEVGPLLLLAFVSFL